MAYQRIGGKTFIMVGMMETGKTYEVKKIIKKFHMLPAYIYDVNEEYYEERINLPEIHEFLDQAKDLSRHVIVFEEATIFFPARGYSNDLVRFIVRKDHTGNVICFCYHSLLDLPTYVLNKIDYVYIKPTNDTLDSVKKKFGAHSRMIEYFEKVKEKSKLDPHYTLKVRGSDF